MPFDPRAVAARRDEALPPGRRHRAAARAASAPRNPPVCVISPFRPGKDPTFIRGLSAGLPTAVTCLHGDPFPRWGENAEPLLASTFAARVRRATGRWLWGLPLEHYAEQALQRFLTQSGTQAVLAQFGPTGVAVLDACERVGIPLIVHFRGYDAYKYDVVERYAESYRRLLTRAGAIAVVSRAMREQLLQLGARPERLHYVPSGVDPSLFADGRPRAQPPHFVAVSRFIEKKGPGHTIRAFAMIATDIPAARLTMIGDGPLLAACRRQVAEARLGDRVRFLGAVPHTAVAARLREARAFVQHSLRASDGDAEGTPNAVVEAGATGIPVIATRHMGIREAVVEEVTGLLVDEGDVEGMAAAMRRVARDADFAARLGEAGRRYVAAHFNRVDCLRRLMEIVRDAVDRNDARYAVAR